MKLNIPELKERIETGPLKVNDDWTGIFVRGDNALYFAMILEKVLAEKQFDVIDTAVLNGLKDLLNSSNEYAQEK